MSPIEKFVTSPPTGIRPPTPIGQSQAVTPAALRYLNRLSDLLFILSRVANPDSDVLWKPGGSEQG